jgi:hypothetical protein
MGKNFLKYFMVSCLLTVASCGPTKRMEPYPTFIGLFDKGPDFLPPIILVGRILASTRIGPRRLSIWDGKTLYQEYRTTVAVENVVKGELPSGTAEIYFLVNLRGGGRKILGTLNDGGCWHIGDREMFFLQRDRGRLRTICDTFAHDCVLPVLSGSHTSIQPHRWVGDAIAEIFLTRGKGAADAQLIEGMDEATSISFHFSPSFSMTKLEEMVQTETLPVRQAACEYLRMYSRSATYNNPDKKILTSNPDFSKAISRCRP